MLFKSYNQQLPFVSRLILKTQEYIRFKSNIGIHMCLCISLKNVCYIFKNLLNFEIIQTYRGYQITTKFPDSKYLFSLSMGRHRDR